MRLSPISGHVTPLLPRLRRQIRWRLQRAEVSDQRPDAFGTERTAEGWHAFRAPVEDRIENLGVGAAVAPAAVTEIGRDPAAGIASMATIAIHRREQQRSVVRNGCIACMRIAQCRAWRRYIARCEM